LKSESNRIHASGIKVFFIQKECNHGSSKINNIHSSDHSESLYISQIWRILGVSAISILKHSLLQQIICVFSHILPLIKIKNNKKVNKKAKTVKTIQIICFDDFAIFNFLI
jgi:hypothetical protein